jgi:hypothetical protein
MMRTLENAGKGRNECKSNACTLLANAMEYTLLGERAYFIAKRFCTASFWGGCGE